MHRYMRSIFLGILISGFFLFLSCTGGEEGIPLPTNPLVKFALPRAVLSLSISPDTINVGESLSTEWVLTQIVGTGFGVDLESGWIDYITQNDTIKTTTTLAPNSLWGTDYLPENDTLRTNYTFNSILGAGGHISVSFTSLDLYDHNDTVRAIVFIR